jgi:YegS/Rv2252/BmrU family lipid kinase
MPMSVRVKPKRIARPLERAPDVLVVLNTAAGNTASSEAQTAIHEALTSRRLHHAIFVISAGGDAREPIDRAVARAVGRGCRRVVAVGGDGTVAMTGAAVMRCGRRARTLALAIVATGTANVLARELGIPLAIDAAITLALDGDRTIELDAIQAEDRPVFTQVGVGLDAQMIRHTSRADQIQRGRLAYALAFLRRAKANRSEWYDLEIDDQTLRVRALQIVVANMGVLGAPPLTWGPGIDPSDGSLDLCVYGGRTAMDYVTLALRLVLGRHRRDHRTRYFRVNRRVVIRSFRPVLVQGDGEILGRTPITLEVAPHALRVVVSKDLEGVEPTVGAPMDTAPSKPATSGRPRVTDPGETIAEDVETMVAQHSRTWLLQGWLRHPFAFVSALDAALYMRLNALQLGPVPDRALVWISKIMHYGEGWAIVAALMLAADFRTAVKVILEALPVLWATMLTVNYPLKSIFRRRRPFIAFVRARVLGPKPKDFSFPSGHTAAAFAGALLFGAHMPLWSPGFYGLAVVVGFARVYLGVHYPSDVLIGAVVGTVLAGTYLALLRLVVSVWG